MGWKNQGGFCTDTGSVRFKGTWNASTNTPDLSTSSPRKGYYYVVSVAGSTSLGGVTSWGAGDWAIYDGTGWSKVDNAAYQPLDPTLTALAAVVTAADKLVYATGSDTFATATLTSFARSLLASTGVLTHESGIVSTGAGQSGSVAGDARGVGAVDLQSSRTLSTQVASGESSTLSGRFGTASGLGSSSIGGSGNRALGVGAHIGGGSWNYNSGQDASILGGQSNAAYQQESGILAGRSNETRQFWATAIGGIGARSEHLGAMTHAAGYFAAVGDAQQTWMVLRGTTTSASPVELKAGLSPAAYRFTMTDDSTCAVEVTIAARRTDANGESAGYKRFLVVDRNGGTTALVGDPVSIDIEDNPAWDVSITADDTNDALIVTVTGEAGKTIYWVAAIHAVKVLG